MHLIVFELVTSRYHNYVPTGSVKQVEVIRPRLYRHGSPAGTVKVQILSNAAALIAESNSRTIADIGTGTHWHGMANFTIAASLTPGTTYRIQVITSGYTFDENAYLGWCNGFSLGRYETTYPDDNQWVKPLDVEIWTRQQISKGAY